MSIATLVAGGPVGPGSTNRVAILAIQARLKIPATGVYDNMTTDAVTAFQHAHALDRQGLTAWGVTGHLTALAMDALDGEVMPASPAAAPATVAVVARSNFNVAPVWFQLALHEVGIHEVGNNGGPDVARYIKAAQAGQIGWPWCMIFVNAMLENSSVRGTRSASSQSPRHDPNFISLNGPALGAICVFWRGSRASGLGHVGFYRGEAPDRVYVLGGNEGDAVKIEALPKAGNTMGLIGYFWPKGVPLPTIGAILIHAGEPLTSVKVV